MPTKFLELFIDGITLKRETVTKCNMETHINTISTKISKNIGILYRTRLIIPRKQYFQLYFAFVHSYLNFGNLAWVSAQKTKFSTLYRQ